jgi:hypothetical protein
MSDDPKAARIRLTPRPEVGPRFLFRAETLHHRGAGRALTEDEQDVVAAFHEAGHAVVGSVVGRYVQSVWLQVDPVWGHFGEHTVRLRPSDGHSATGAPRPGVMVRSRRKVRQLFGDALWLLAGELAERRGARFDAAVEGDGQAEQLHDIYEVNDLDLLRDVYVRLLHSGAVRSESLQDFVDECVPHALAVLEAYWPAVTACAADLLAHRRVSGARLRATVAAVAPQRPVGAHAPGVAALDAGVTARGRRDARRLERWVIARAERG